jgi:hypothetical protein
MSTVTLCCKIRAYDLPDEPVHYQRFQWLGKENVDAGGEDLGSRGRA